MAKQARSGLVVSSRSVAELSNDPANARKHSERNIESIKASLQRFGQQKPIVVDSSGVVRAGNGTLAAAKALGWDKIGCVVTDLTGAEATAYAIADNRTAELAEWDDDVLAATLQSLEAEDPSLLIDTGFDEKELAKLVAQTSEPLEDDEVPEPPADPITKPGDLWLLGEHRVLCGDSTVLVDMQRLMEGVKAHICVTDPPYNIDYGNIEHPKFKQRDIKNDNMGADKFRFFCRQFVANIKDHTVGCVYCFGSPGPDGRIMFSELDAALHCSTTIVWNKDVFTLGRGKYQNKYEPCWFGWVESGARFSKERNLENVWNIPRPKASKEHPTMKPIELIARCIEHASIPTDIVLDPFLGSGTTLIAAEQLGRKCYGLEIDPAYCDVIVQRWEKLTGKKATLEQ